MAKEHDAAKLVLEALASISENVSAILMTLETLERSSMTLAKLDPPAVLPDILLQEGFRLIENNAAALYASLAAPRLASLALAKSDKHQKARESIIELTSVILRRSEMIATQAEADRAS